MATHRHRSEFRQFSSVPIRNKKQTAPQQKPVKSKDKTSKSDISSTSSHPQDDTIDKENSTARDDNQTRSPSPKSTKTDVRATRYNRRPIQKPGRRDIPVSIESEHRYILSVANHSALELKGFKKRFKAEGLDFAKCKETAVEILDKNKLTEEEIQRADEFRKLIATRKLGHEIHSRDETKHLEMLCEKATKFEELMTDTNSKLTACYQKHLAKYCLSFIEECNKNVYVKYVRDYEDTIENYKSIISERLKEMNEIYEEYSTKSVPFVTGYLEFAETLMIKMDEFINKGLEICETMKKWVSFDKKYPSQLWDEIISDNQVRSKKQDEIKKIRQKKDDHALPLHRKELVRDRAGAKFNEAKIEKKKLKHHKENLDKRIIQTENEISDREKDLESVTYEYNNRKSNSPKLMDVLWNKKEGLELELFKLDERNNMLKRQQERYEKQESELEEKVTDLEYDVMGKQGDVDEIRSKMRSCDQEIADLIKDLKTMEAKIATCKTIREMKFSAATLRKIYFQKLDSSSQDTLMEVCKVVASNIGRDWEALYLDLLFTPPRSKEKRNKDLESIKLNSVRREITGQKLAWQGLQKWRIFNKNGSVQQLLRSLRRLEKYALAHKIEHMHKKATTANS